MKKTLMLVIAPGGSKVEPTCFALGFDKKLLATCSVKGFDLTRSRDLPATLQEKYWSVVTQEPAIIDAGHRLDITGVVHVPDNREGALAAGRWQTWCEHAFGQCVQFEGWPDKDWDLLWSLLDDSERAMVDEQGTIMRTALQLFLWNADRL